MLLGENGILMEGTTVSRGAVRSAERAVEARYAAYLEEAQRLIHAGIDEIRDKGDVEPRVADIVRRAGLSNKAFYRHFKSKDELLLAVLEEGMHQRLEDFEKRMAVGNSPLERARLWVLSVANLAIDPELAAGTRPMLVYQATLHENLGPQVAGTAERLIAPILSALLEAKEAGELADDVDPERVADFVYCAAMGWMHDRILRRTRPSRDEAEALAEFLLRGLRAR